ncbi:MAG: DUF4345 family protein [Planctomycetota bacterium]|jgi:hypothetical protein
MGTVLLGLVGLSCSFLVGLGALTMFAPKSMVGFLAVEPAGPAGLNTIRGFLGGLFLGSSVVLATGLATGNTTFFLAVATTMSVVVVGRFVGIAVDGFDKKVLFPLVLEMVMVAIFIVAYTQLGSL